MLRTYLLTPSQPKNSFQGQISIKSVIHYSGQKQLKRIVEKIKLNKIGKKKSEREEGERERERERERE